MNKSFIVVLACVIGALVLFPVVAKLSAASKTDSNQAAASAVPDVPVPQPIPIPDNGTPAVVMMNPSNGATNVSAQLGQLTVLFNTPMGGGFSWTGGGDQFPETAGKPYWTPDGKTCVLPVHLKPNWSYRLGLNSPSHKNFKSTSGTPLTPVEWRFNTGS